MIKTKFKLMYTWKRRQKDERGKHIDKYTVLDMLPRTLGLHVGKWMFTTLFING